MRLAGEDELHRPRRLVEEPGQPRRVGEEEGRALVRREPPREADRERVRIEREQAAAAAAELPLEPPAGDVDELALAPCVELPQLLVGETARRAPAVGVRIAVDVRAPRAEDVRELGADPGRAVDAVRDRADRHVGVVALRPHVGPHLARDASVQRRDTVREGRGAEGERGEAEAVLVAVRAREPEQVLPHPAVALDRCAEVAPHELGVEDLVPGGHRRVRGEDRRRPDLLDRLVAADAGDEQLTHINSLDAQYDAAQSYIRSQAHAGWTLLRAKYDDGGFSGGNTDRPALQRLLEDVGAGKIDVIVVYKVDRLTRSLADFAKLVELFDTPQGVIRVRHPAVQHHHVDGAADAECAAVVCPVRTRGHLRAHPGQDRRFQTQGPLGRRHGPAWLRHQRPQDIRQ